MEQIEENRLIKDFFAKGLLYIKEQNLKLIIKNYSLYAKKDNMYVIIGNEMKYCHGINIGDLMSGIIRLDIIEENNQLKFMPKVILPFSKRLLYANLLDDGFILLAYVENKRLKNKKIKIQDDGTLVLEDYAFLFEEDIIMQSRSPRLSRVLVKTK